MSHVVVCHIECWAEAMFTNAAAESRLTVKAVVDWLHLSLRHNLLHMWPEIKGESMNVVAILYRDCKPLFYGQLSTTTGLVHYGK